MASIWILPFQWIERTWASARPADAPSQLVALVAIHQLGPNRRRRGAQIRPIFRPGELTSPISSSRSASAVMFPHEISSCTLGRD